MADQCSRKPGIKLYLEVERMCEPHAKELHVRCKRVVDEFITEMGYELDSETAFAERMVSDTGGPDPNKKRLELDLLLKDDPTGKVH